MKILDEINKQRIKRWSVKGRLHRQIAAIIIACISLTIVVCWALNTWLLGDYYVNNKEAVMRSAFEMVDNEAELEDYRNNAEFENNLQRMNENQSLTTIVVGPDGNVLLSTSSDTEGLVRQLQHSIFSSAGESVVLEVNRDYTIERTMDTRVNEEYLVLWGTLSDGNLIMIRTALEGIRDSASISNQFLIYVGVVVILIGIAIAAVIGRQFTRRIRNLADLSKRMSALDFRAKYERRGIYKNEIDELGENFNEMSDTLEKTIYTLKQDIDLLEKSEKTRTDFVSNVSHELKTPISLIKGYAEGLAEGIIEDEESRTEYLEIIMDEADRMNRLVKELITLNQLEDVTAVTENLDDVNIIDMIAGVLENHKLLIEQQNINLEFDREQRAIVIPTDEFLVEQVINNYVSNAIHYCGGEENLIKIECDVLEGDVRVGVFNSGSYIPKEDINNIWDKFYKVDKARTREYGGSGIGLSIVKAAMERLSGEYGVINRADGVEFYFVLKSALKN